MEPPPLPLQLHVQGPMPATALAVPAEQRPETGADAVGILFDGPHAPWMIACDEQPDAVPPFAPEQFHVCQTAFKRDPRSASKRDPLFG